jgi:hypothetical protein
MTLRLVDDKPFGAEYGRLLQDLQMSYQKFIGDPMGKKYMMNRMKKLLKTDENGNRIIPEAEFSHQNADCLRKKGVPWLLHSLPDGFPFIDSRSSDGLAALRAARNATNVNDVLDALELINNLNFRYQFPDLLPRDQYGRLVKLPIFRKHNNILANPDGAFKYVLRSMSAVRVAALRARQARQTPQARQARQARVVAARARRAEMLARAQADIDAAREATAARENQIALQLEERLLRLQQEQVGLRRERQRQARADAAEARARLQRERGRRTRQNAGSSKVVRRVNEAVASGISSPAPASAQTEPQFTSPEIDQANETLRQGRNLLDELDNTADISAQRARIARESRERLEQGRNLLNKFSSVDSPSSGESKSSNAVRDLNSEFVDDIGNPTDIAARIRTFQQNVAIERNSDKLRGYIAEMVSLKQKLEQNSETRMEMYVENGVWKADLLIDNYKQLNKAISDAKSKLVKIKLDSGGESKYQAGIDTTVATVNNIKKYSEIRSLLRAQRQRGGASQLKPIAQRAFAFILPKSELIELFQQNKQIRQWQRELKYIKQRLNKSNPEDMPKCKFDDTVEGVTKWVTQRFRLLTRILYLDPGLELDDSMSNSDLIRIIESNFQTGFASNEKVESLDLITRKNLTKLADPDLHMIQMDLAYTRDKKMYTI